MHTLVDQTCLLLSAGQAAATLAPGLVATALVPGLAARTHCAWVKAAGREAGASCSC